MRGNPVAKQIYNIAELISDVQKRFKANDQSIADSIKTTSGKSFTAMTRENLREAAESLEDYLRGWIQDYFDSYTPTVYKRTGRLLESIQSTVISENGKLKAIVYFGNDGAIRDSLWEGQPRGYVPALLNDGWAVKNGWHQNINHFGFQDGFGFMEFAVAEAKRDPRFKNIDIEIIKASSF